MPHPTPTSEITVPRPKFDRAAPVPDRLMHAALATGVAQAPTPRLLGTMLVAATGAVLVLLIVPGCWVLAAPGLCVAALAGWGLTTKRLMILRLNLSEAPVLSAVLHVLRAAMALLGVAALLAGLAGFLRMLLSPWWL